jgi:hypothetical protein
MNHYANILVKKARENNPSNLKEEIKNLVILMNISNGTQEYLFLTLCYKTSEL